MHPGDLYELTRDCILRVFLRILWRPQIRSQIQTNTPQIQDDVRISWVGVPQLQIRSKYAANMQLRHVLAPSSLALGSQCHLRCDRHPNTSRHAYLCVFVMYLWCICEVLVSGREIRVFVMYLMRICKIFENGRIHGCCHVSRSATSFVFLRICCVFVFFSGTLRNTQQIRKNTQKYA